MEFFNENTVFTAVIVAVITSILNFWVQRYLFELQRERKLRQERLTHLLLPLYIRINTEDADFLAETAGEVGDPAVFLDDLPAYYKPLEEVISKYLYLADEELTVKALNFLAWRRIAGVDRKRFDKVMTSGINDKELNAFKKCVNRKYKEKSTFPEKDGTNYKNWTSDNPSAR